MARIKEGLAEEIINRLPLVLNTANAADALQQAAAKREIVEFQLNGKRIIGAVGRTPNPNKLIAATLTIPPRIIEIDLAKVRADPDWRLPGETGEEVTETRTREVAGHNRDYLGLALIFLKAAGQALDVIDPPKKKKRWFRR